MLPVSLDCPFCLSLRYSLTFIYMICLWQIVVIHFSLCQENGHSCGISASCCRVTNGSLYRHRWRICICLQCRARLWRNWWWWWWRFGTRLYRWVKVLLPNIQIQSKLYKEITVGTKIKWSYKTGDLFKEVQFIWNFLWQDKKKVTF